MTQISENLILTRI